MLGVPRSGSLEGTVLISGTGHDLSPHYPGDGNLSEWAGLRRACSRAYAAAGIDDPETAFVVAEPSCLFPHEETLFVEATRIGRSTTVSPDGGLFAGTAPVAAGLSRLVARCGRWRVGPAAERWPTAPGVPRARDRR